MKHRFEREGPVNSTTRSLVVVLVLSLFVIPNPVLGRVDSKTGILEWKGAMMPGKPVAMEVEGDYAFVATMSGLQVLNLTDPVNPFQESFLALPRAIDLLYVKEGLAVLGGGIEVSLVDISEPSNPQITAQLTMSGYLKGAIRNGDHLYLILSYVGLKVLNISEPRNPEIVGDHSKYISNYNNILDMAIFEKKLFIVDYYTTTVLNISLPEEPTSVHSTFLLHYGIQLQFNKDLLYVIQSQYYLRIRDMVQFPNEEVLGEMQMQCKVVALRIHGQVAIVGCQRAGVKLVDLSDPYQLREIGRLELSDTLLDMELLGTDHVAVLSQDSGLLIVDVSETRGPLQRTSASLDFTIEKASLDHTLLYALTHDNTEDHLRIIDLADPVVPVVLSQMELPRSSFDLFKFGELVIINTGTTGLILIDVADLLEPWEVSRIETYVRGDMAMYGDRLFLADKYGGSKVYDLSNRAKPYEVNIAGFTEGRYEELEIIGELLFASWQYSSLHVFKMEAQGEVTELTKYHQISSPSAMFAHGNLLFLSGSGRGIDAYQMVGDELVWRDEYPTAYTYGDLHIKEERLYFVSSQNDIHILDTNNPANLSLEMKIPGINYRELYLVGEKLFLVESGYDVSIIEFSERRGPITVSEYNYYSVNLVEYHKGMLFVSFWEGEVIIMASNDSLKWKKIASLGYSGPLSSMFFHEDKIYLLEYGGRLKVVNIASPQAPKELGQFDLGDTAFALQVFNGVAYVGMLDDRIERLNVSDPQNITSMGNWLTGDSIYTLFQINGHLFFAPDATGTMAVRDLENLQDPPQSVILEGGGLMNSLRGIKHMGGDLYLAHFNAGFMVFNLSNPHLPQQLDSSLPMSIYPYAVDVEVTQDHAFAALADHGLMVYEISQEGDVLKVGQYLHNLEYTTRVCIVEDLLFVVDHYSQLNIFEINIPSTARPTVLITPELHYLYPYTNKPQPFHQYRADSELHHTQIESYQWFSDMDGALGSSSSVSSRDLSVGEHQLWLRILDENGRWSERAYLNVTVGAKIEPPASQDPGNRPAQATTEEGHVPEALPAQLLLLIGALFCLGAFLAGENRRRLQEEQRRKAMRERALELARQRTREARVQRETKLADHNLWKPGNGNGN